MSEINLPSKQIGLQIPDVTNCTKLHRTPQWQFPKEGDNMSRLQCSQESMNVIKDSFLAS